MVHYTTLSASTTGQAPSRTDHADRPLHPRGGDVWKGYRNRIDYLKVRQHIEADINDTVDEGYFFNADDDPPKASKLHNALAYPPPKGPGLRVKIRLAPA